MSARITIKGTLQTVNECDVPEEGFHRYITLNDGSVVYPGETFVNAVLMEEYGTDSVGDYRPTINVHTYMRVGQEVTEDLLKRELRDARFRSSRDIHLVEELQEHFGDL